MSNLKKIIFVLALFLSLQSFAQFELNGVIRPRAEYRNGYSTLRDSLVDAASFISQRTRLGIKYTKDDIKVGITFYDFRVWGDQLLKSDASFVGLAEGWAEIQLSESVALKIGRQSLSYDNNRLLSPVNWNQVGAAHDLVLLKYRKAGWIFDFGAAYNQAGINKFGTDYSGYISNYRTLNFIWLSHQFGKTNIAFQGFLDGFQKEGTKSTIYMRYTPGFIVKYKNDGHHLTGRAFYQGGKIQTGEDVSAWYVNVDGGLAVSKKMTSIGGAEIFSGNDATDSLRTADHAFNILYGARHKFNGDMDYFSTPNTTNRAGLVNPYFRLKYDISKKVDLYATYHYFQLFGDYIENGELIDKTLGSEIDLKFKIKFKEYVKLEGGYAFLLPTQSMSVIKGGDHHEYNSWAYVMLTIDPVFFTN
ncbi:MAG: hypothetical protein DRJ05_07895 [Bacteroidetes bacterium]|nr:MAG: hypothetical protein DRJ05_07895 [Bacteroidota bacterium]